MLSSVEVAHWQMHSSVRLAVPLFVAVMLNCRVTVLRVLARVIHKQSSKDPLHGEARRTRQHLGVFRQFRLVTIARTTRLVI
jgi:hypothetical protein